MSENQPREFDAVLGGSTSPIFTSAVLGGIEGVKQRLKHKNVNVRFDALWDALNYGEAGLDLIAQRLHDSSQKVYRYAELLLRERGGEKGKKSLLSGASQFCMIKILVVIANEVKQSQSLAIASFHFVPLAMTNSIFTHLGCSPFILQSVEIFDNNKKLENTQI